METRGTGADVVLLHGWGLHGGVFTDLVEAMARYARVTVVDLPGHGRSAYAENALEMPALCARLARQLPAPAIWLGWSLGGLIALSMTRYQPASVRALILTATTPRFTRASDWPHAMAPEVLAGFSDALADDYQATLLRFLALQTRGGEDAAGSLRRLRACLRETPEPELAALQSGLRLLAETDRRDDVPAVQVPVLALAGERDTLVPLAAMHALVERLPRAQLQVYTGAGHAPFLSHANAFAADVEHFIGYLP